MGAGKVRKEEEKKGKKGKKKERGDLWVDLLAT